MKIYNMKINGEHFTAQILEYNVRKAKLLVNGIEYKVEFESEENVNTQPDTPPIPTVEKVSPIPPAPTEKPSPAPATTKTIKSPLPGLILDIKVNVGDTISPGQTIAVIEAMKMESDIVCDFAGTVADVLVSRGQNVSEGQELLVVSC